MEQLTPNEKAILNTIRKLNNEDTKFNKNDIASTLGIQWNTVSNIFSSLIDKQMLCEDGLALKSDYEYYVGISLGSSRIKIVFLDFSFNICSFRSDALYLDYYKNFKIKYKDIIDMENNNSNIDNSLTTMSLCLNANAKQYSNGYNAIAFILNDLCEMIVNMKKSGLNIGSIGFAFPGVIDSKNKKIISSYLFGNASDIGLKDLISDSIFSKFNDCFTKDEDYIFEQNSISATIAEKEIGCIHKENTAIIYGGFGYGLGLVINNKLYPTGGQLGHMSVIPYNTETIQNQPVCRCGQINCLENRINTDVFEKVQGEENLLKSKSVNELKNMLKDNLEKKLIFSEYLSQAIYNIAQILGIKNIVLTGKLSKLYECISTELKNALLDKNITSQIIKISALGEFAAAYGIAIQSYYTKYNIPLEWKY